MKALALVLFSLFPLLIMACGQSGSYFNGSTEANEGEVLTMHVAAETRECPWLVPMELLVVDGECFYGDIRGFDHEDGFEYTLSVRKTRKAEEELQTDSSEYRYELLEVLSKSEVAEEPPLLSTWPGMPTPTPVPEHMDAVRAACADAGDAEFYTVMTHSRYNIDVTVSGGRIYQKTWIPGAGDTGVTEHIIDEDGTMYRRSWDPADTDWRIQPTPTPATEGFVTFTVGKDVLLWPPDIVCQEPANIRYVHEETVKGTLTDHYFEFKKREDGSSEAWYYWIDKDGVLVKSKYESKVDTGTDTEIELEVWVIDVGVPMDIQIPTEINYTTPPPTPTPEEAILGFTPTPTPTSTP